MNRSPYTPWWDIVDKLLRASTWRGKLPEELRSVILAVILVLLWASEAGLID